MEGYVISGPKRRLEAILLDFQILSTDQYMRWFCCPWCMECNPTFSSNMVSEEDCLDIKIELMDLSLALSTVCGSGTVHRRAFKLLPVCRTLIVE